MKLIGLLGFAAVAEASIDIFRYESVIDVTEHNKIDLDVKEMEAFAKGSGDFVGAKDIYENGKNSQNGDKLRTLQGFSTGLVGKAEKLLAFSPDMLSEWKLFTEYYQSTTYGDDFVSDALNNEGMFFNMTDAARAQYVVKGSQYQNVWMYVLREFYEAVRACREGNKAPKAWDEGVAFYTGSSIAPSGGSGYLLFTFAQKRGSSFKTELDNGLAIANDLAFTYFDEGKVAVDEMNCREIQYSIYRVRRQMQIPLLQGVIQYAIKSDKAKTTDPSPKSKAEAWAFLAGVLPFIDEIDSQIAQNLRKNLEYNTNSTEENYLVDGSDAVINDVYTILPSMCISCEDIGANNLDNTPECKTDEFLIEGNPACSIYFETTNNDDDEDDDTNTGLIIGLSVLGVVVIALLCGGMWYLGSTKNDDDTPPKASKPESFQNEEELQKDVSQV